MKTVFGIVLLTAVVGGLYLLNDATRTEDGKSVLHVADEPEVTVKVAAPERRAIIRTVQAPGEVEPLSEVDISAEVVAKILEMPVEEGDVVEMGQLLCRLDDADYRARLRSAEANVAKLKAVIVQAEADLEKAQRDYRRQADLFEMNATGSVELADYHTALIRARTGVEVRRQELVEAESTLQAAQEDLAKTVIEAPIDGVISQLFAKQGEVVVTGTMNNPGTRIMVVSDLSKMQLRCRVDESDAPFVQPEQMARIYLQSDTQRSIPGHVLRVATKGSKPTGRDVVTFETLVLVDSDDPHVKPGMSANVEIEVDTSEGALTIPIEAVVNRKRKDLPEELVKEFEETRAADISPRGSESATGHRARTEARAKAEYLKTVFCVVDDKAHPRLVVTGISDETSVEIVSGVAQDDLIVTGPYRSLDQLKDGSPITREKEDTPEEKTAEGEAEKEAPAESDTNEAHASAGGG